MRWRLRLAISLTPSTLGTTTSRWAAPAYALTWATVSACALRCRWWDHSAAEPGAIDTIRQGLSAAARGSGLTDILALELVAALNPVGAGAGSARITLIARVGVCEHLVTTGRCASHAGEAVVSQASRWRVGDEIHQPPTIRYGCV